jgi:regulatory protein
MTSKEQKEIFWYNKAMHWCSRRELCESDIKDRLLKSELNAEEVTTIIQKLVDEKFIDENRFVRAFVHDKFEFQKWGLLKIKQSLYFKGIPEEIITENLQSVDKEMYLKKFQDIAQSKWKTIKGESAYEIDQKLLRFLASKGVSTDDAYHILKKIKIKE